MNFICLTGRLVKDPEIKEVGEKKTKLSEFTVAVDRNRYNPNAESTANFIRCQTWGKSCEFLEKWCKKGVKLEIHGELVTSSYKNKDGNTVYQTHVVTDMVKFAESKKAMDEAAASAPAEPKKEEDDFMSVGTSGDFDNDEVPFA